MPPRTLSNDMVLAMTFMHPFLHHLQVKSTQVVLCLLIFTAIIVPMGCSSSTDPNEKVQAGLTAKEAEQLAADRALSQLGDPILINIFTPEAGGGVNREGRLAKGANGKWWFAYMEQGDFKALIVEIEGARVYSEFVSLDNVPGVQEIGPDYLDSEDVVKAAETNGGKNLQDVTLILCNLTGEPVWPSVAPRKVAWVVTYQSDSGNETFYIDAYTGVFLGQ